MAPFIRNFTEVVSFTCLQHHWCHMTQMLLLWAQNTLGFPHNLVYKLELPWYTPVHALPHHCKICASHKHAPQIPYAQII